MAAVEIAELFETPLLHVPIAQAAAIDAPLRELIRRRRRSHPAADPAFPAEWHSDRDMLAWGGDVALLLLDGITALADAYTADVGRQDLRRYAWAPEMWASARWRGAAGPHRCHPGAFWTAIYYIDDGYAGATDQSLGGELEFEDPRLPTLLADGPHLRIVTGPNAPPPATALRIRPAPGQLLVFPGWLRHATRPLLTAGEQLTVTVALRPIQAPPNRRASAGIPLPSGLNRLHGYHSR